MPQALAPLFATWFSLSAMQASVLASVVVSVAMSLASYVISSALNNASQESDLPNNTVSDRGQLVNSESTSEVIPLPYGRCRVGVNRVYRSLGGTDNEYIHIIGTISEGEIEGVVAVDEVDQIWLGEKLISDELFTGLVDYEIFNGGSDNTSVCATLKAACPDWDDYLPYTAYIYLKLKYDRNVFQGIPQITMLIDGLKVYNPSTELTAYSSNPALCARDFITRSARRGGMGIAASRLDDTTFTAAATYCSAKGWTIGLPICEDQSASDNLAQILSCFRGALIYSGTLYKLKYKDLNYETAIMDVDENDVVFSGSESSLIISQPSIFDTPNGVCIKYIDEELNYQGNDYVLSDQELIEADGGDYREETVTINGINSLANVQQMAAYLLERLRYNKTVEHQGGSRLMALEPMDIINFTHEIPGWEDKVLRVERIGFDQDGNVKISYIEEDDSYYDDEYDVSEHTVPDTNIINPSTRPPSVTGVTLTEEVYYYRERSFTRLKIDFDPPAKATYPYWKGVKVWVKIGEGSYRYMTSVEDNYSIDPVNEGETYYVKLQSYSVWDVEELLSSVSEWSHLVIGKTERPADLPSFLAIASGDSVTLISPALTDPDIEGYEIRIGGNAWLGATLFGFYKAPMVRITGVKPGTHTFSMAAKGNNGLYSDTPSSASVTVFYPAGYSDKNSWAWDFSTGSHTNTEQDTYGGNNVLKCSHTDDVLTGNWLSPEYDLGSIKTVRVWGDFLTEFIGSENTWDDIFPSGDTWDDNAPKPTSWNQLQAIEALAAVLSATIYWGDTSGTLTNEADFFQILAPEFSARYVQVRVTITDNALGSQLYLKTLNMKAAYWS